MSDMYGTDDLDLAESVEEKFQGGWVSEGKHKYRRVSKEERIVTTPVEVIQRSDLSIDQENVYRQLKAWYDNCGSGDTLRLGGYAGTGKSTLISVFAKEYADERIAFCAFTGKAANVLKQKLAAAGIMDNEFSRPIRTIHRLIYRPIFGKGGAPIGWSRVEELSYDLIIVDEGSMVDAKLFEDLCSYGIPILVVGDHGQLPPIGGGGASLMDHPDLRLEKIHRQAENNPIILLAQYVRQTGHLPDRYDSNEHVEFLNPNHLRAKLASIYRENMTGEELGEIGVLCFTNKKRMMVNQMVRDIRFKADINAPPKQGDQIICLRNNFNIIFNGMRGQVVSVRELEEYWHYIYVNFYEDDLELKGLMLKGQFLRERTISSWEEGRKYIPSLKERGWNFAIGLLFDYGYCLTTHKAQGSSFKKTIMLYERPYNIDAQEFSKWLYTTITRSSDKLTIVTR